MTIAPLSSTSIAPQGVRRLEAIADLFQVMFSAILRRLETRGNSPYFGL